MVGPSGVFKREVISFDEFTKIFCKGLFKEALIKISSQVESVQKAADALPLNIQIN